MRVQRRAAHAGHRDRERERREPDREAEVRVVAGLLVAVVGVVAVVGHDVQVDNHEREGAHELDEE